MRAVRTALTVTFIAVAGCEPFLADLPDLLPPTDGPDAGDTATPTVFFAAPDNNATITGTVTLEVSAVDAEGPVRAVALSIDDVAAGSREAPPFNFDIDTATLGDGPHAFSAVATDAADNTADAAITLVVANIAPQLRIDAPLATQSDSDVALVVTSQVPLRALSLRVGDAVVETVADDARLVFTATVRVPAGAAPAIRVTASGVDDEEQEGTAEFSLTVDDTPRTLSVQVEPTTETHVASPFDVAIAVEPDEAGAAGAPIVSCAVCAEVRCDDDASFVEVAVVDGACSPRSALLCTAGDEIVVAARVVDAAGNVGTSTLTRTCSEPPTTAPRVEAIESALDSTTTVTWSGPAPGVGDAGIDHFLLTTRIDGGEPAALQVPGPLSHTLTLPACVVVDVEVAAVDVFGRSSPASARRAMTHCGHDGSFTTISLELDADGSASLAAPGALRELATVADLDLGDIDHDGDLDIVVFGERSNGARRVLRLRQIASVDAQPMFVALDHLTTGADGNARQVVLADLNADGDLDVVAMSNQQTAFFAASGNGDFAAATILDVGRASAVVGPLTRGDGQVDLLLNADDVILPGGRGALTPTACAAGGTLFAVADADGLPGAELLVYNSTNGLLRLRKRDGANATCPFSATSTDVYSHTQSNLVTAVVLDTDGNGRPDLARLRTREIVVDRDAAFFAAGTNATAPVLIPQTAVDAAAIDLESDGDDDLVIIDDRSPGNVRFVRVEQGTLTLGDVIPLAGRLQQVKVADVDGDGVDDVVVAAEEPPAVHILKGGGVRRRGDRGAVLFHQTSGTGAVAAASFDIDRDGDLDVLSAGSAGVVAIDVDVAGISTAPLTDASLNVTAFAASVVDVARGASVLFGTAPGDWALLNDSGVTETLAAAFAPARAIGAVDIDDDGDVDSLGVFPQLAVRLNQGGSFVAGPATPTTTANAVALAVADVDNDGLLDVIIAGDEIDIVSLQPTMALTGTLTCAGPATDVAVADVDHDGHADLLAACAGPSPSLLFARNNGDSPATFSLTEAIIGGDSVGPLAAGDLDGDGDVDVVVGTTDAGSGALRVVRNDGGSFVVDSDVFGAPGRVLRDLQLVDLDGDGPLDVIATLGDGTVAILHGTASR